MTFALPGHAHADSDAASADHHVILPSPRAFVRHALPNLIESTIGPAVVFYVVLVLGGFRGAIIGALAWSYLALVRRVVRRQPVPGLLVLGVGLISLRTAISFVTGSAFLYFAGPTLGTFLVAALFLGSVVARRPLAERLARDFCPLDPAILARPHLRRFFLHVSLLWCAVLAVESGLIMWLLLESSVRAFVIERTVVSVGLIGAGIAVSTWWFVRVMGRHGIGVRWHRKVVAATVPAVTD